MNSERESARQASERGDGVSVVVASDYLPPSQGGVEVVVTNLVSHLPIENDQIRIFTLEPDGDDVPERLRDFRIVRTPTRDLTAAIGLQTRVSLRSFRRLRQLVSETDADVLHVHNRFFFVTLVAAVLKKLSSADRPSLVLTLHLGTVANLNGIGKWIGMLYERTVGRFILGQCDAVIAVSEAVAEHGIALGADPDIVTVVPNGVDAETFSPPETARSPETAGQRILFIGRLVKNKGPHTLIAAIARLADQFPDLEVVLVGTGPLEDRLRRQVREAGLDSQVRFIERVDEVAPVMREADVFCRPSTSEGMPLTMLEAMASGLPAVVTPVAGVPEVIEDGTTGLFVPPERPDALAETLRRLLQDPRRIVDIGAAAREAVVEKYTWQRRGDAVYDVYEASRSE